MFLPSRHAELLDLLVNVTGLVLGHVSVGWVGPTWGANWQLALARAFFRVTLLLLWAIVWCVVVLLPLFCASLDDWDPTYRLLIGNEEGGGRRWDGEIQSIAVFARSLTDDQVRIMLDHPPGREESTLIRRTMGLLWASDFTRLGRVETSVDGAEVSSDLQINLPAHSRWTAETPPGLILDGRHLLGTVGAAESLTESIVRSDAFSIEVWCRPQTSFSAGRPELWVSPMVSGGGTSRWDRRPTHSYFGFGIRSMALTGTGSRYLHLPRSGLHRSRSWPLMIVGSRRCSETAAD
jgi:hypothetical protein